MFDYQISGDVDPEDTVKHAALQALGQALVDQLAILGVTVTSSSVSTPSGATTPIPKNPQPAA